eukprot:UN02120
MSHISEDKCMLLVKTQHTTIPLYSLTQAILFYKHTKQFIVCCIDSYGGMIDNVQYLKRIMALTKLKQQEEIKKEQLLKQQEEERQLRKLFNTRYYLQQNQNVNNTTTPISSTNTTNTNTNNNTPLSITNIDHSFVDEGISINPNNNNTSIGTTSTSVLATPLNLSNNPSQNNSNNNDNSTTPQQNEKQVEEEEEVADSWDME